MRNTIVSFLAFFAVCSFAAHASPYTLKTGEHLIDSEYITTHSLFGDSRLVLQVEFEPGEVDKDLRNLSLIEILAEHLLPSASKAGKKKVSVWETLHQGKVGPEAGGFSLKLSAGAYENYDFELGDDWIWHQTAGPDIDLSGIGIRQHTYNPELGAHITELVEQRVEEWKYFEVWAHVEDASPSEATEKANDIFNHFSGCSSDGVPIEKDSFLGQNEAIAFRIYMVPRLPSSPLQYQPRLKFTFGHEAYVAHCYSISTDPAKTWDDLYDELRED